MHPVIEFYLEQRKSQHNLSLQDMWAMPKRMVGDAYLYIPWLLPVTESSKWNRSVPVFNEEDLAIFLLEMRQFKINIYILLILFWITSVYIVKIIKYYQNLN